MPKITFSKIVAAGNDFILIDEPRNSSKAYLKKLAKQICSRKYGVGADGLLTVSRIKKTDIKMRIFNSDGSEAHMCGNGSRCAAFYSLNNKLSGKMGKIHTKAGLIDFNIEQDMVKVRLTPPKDMRLDFSLNLNARSIKANFINTGVPHVVIFVDNIKNHDVLNLGRYIRYHEAFKPDGTNVNFVQILGDNSIKVRTYERGVESETLACGTGSAAAALITALKLGSNGAGKINVQTSGGEILFIHFIKNSSGFGGVWLEGKVKLVFKGEFVT